MTTELTGYNSIAGEWIAGQDGAHAFRAPEEAGTQDAAAVPAFTSATGEQLDLAVQRAVEAFADYGASAREQRAQFLEAIAAELESRRESLVAVAHRESGLPTARLEGELGRTCGQLRMFAQLVQDGEYLERRKTPALPDREPIPRPDLRLMMRPLGPVAVFGASNFPLAFSVAGGDTASALAAGCPVVVKGHPAHPGTSEVAAQAINAAARTASVPAGVFSLLQDSSHEVARRLVQHPDIRAVGFTGSLRAGRALFDLCSARPEPIPFFGELGSINPVFVLPGALEARGREVAQGWVGSLTLGAGQFCTNPGVIFVPMGEAGDVFVEAAAEACEDAVEQLMLTDGIAAACQAGAERLGATPGVQTRFSSRIDGRRARGDLFETDAETWLERPELAEEVFGPVGLIVRTQDEHQVREVARGLAGQLTVTVLLEDSDHEVASRLLPIVEQKAGRLLANGFPTGVEVDPAMMHGGPYPASTNASTTSVGTLAIRRFLRPVCYQSIPMDLLPADLRDA